ncbi:MAG: hypothetical protein AMQ22_00102 [Candidatus Methanofastidiosum methylothiophilum]|uniref:Uncharacterized protein n=1 Tax=Candidatus Methanofastidiosum methylothiophilum TaxID=1705564 RepID=A0A150J943_9EURY|nr:MAG: hypothetical protein AMQ22_00102 [Candidatus Methanofastidiosum methylthiophilus]
MLYFKNKLYNKAFFIYSLVNLALKIRYLGGNPFGRRFL